MKMLPAMAISIASLLSAPCAAAVYRCADGSFQDKPCDKGDGKVVTKRDTVGKARPPDDECATGGLEVLEIARARADGKTSDAMLAATDKSYLSYAKKLERKKLIVDVFRKSGTPQEIAVSFEAACAARLEAEKKARAEAQKKQTCDRLQSNRESVLASQRAGGSVTTMEALNRALKDIDRQLSEAGCT